MDIPIHCNLSYVKVPGTSNSTRARGVFSSQAVTVEGGVGPDYSSIGPNYETIDSRSGQSQRKNQVPTGRLSDSERYSEVCIHLATLNENAPEGLGSANSFEVPLNLRQNVSTGSEDY